VHEVLTEGRRRCWIPELPGGQRTDPASLTVSLEDMASTVCEHIGQIEHPRDLTLIVHGLAGPIGQLVAALAAPAIARIVWVDAWLMDQAPGGLDHLGDQLPNPLKPLAGHAERGQPVPMDAITWRAFFAQDATEEAHETGLSQLSASVCPPAWLASAVDVGDFWDLLLDPPWQQAYLHCLDDRALPYATQLGVVEQLRPERTATMPGSHCAFHANPARFVATLMDLARTRPHHIERHWDTEHAAGGKWARWANE
jgi:hypothetical protein